MKNFEDRELGAFWEKIARMPDGEAEKMAEHIEVLNKVKALMTIPGFDAMTIRQVAEYYEVDIDTVRRVYQRHKTEIDADGAAVMKPRDFLIGSKVQLGSEEVDFRAEQIVQPKIGVGDPLTELSVQLGTGADNSLTGPEVQFIRGVRGATTLSFKDGFTIELNNYGTRVFSRRAVLRIGMLTPCSKVATEVRTQLLNAVEKLPAPALVEEIDKEIALRKKIGDAFTGGNFMEASGYMIQLTEYLDRHNKALREANKELTDTAERLDTENKVLLKEEMEWDTRKLINAIVRRIAGVRYPDGGSWKYGRMWGYWKSLLYNKEGIGISRRLGNDNKSSYLDMLRDDEWPAAMSCTLTFAKQYGVDISDLLVHAKEGILDECKC